MGTTSGPSSGSAICATPRRWRRCSAERRFSPPSISSSRPPPARRSITAARCCASSAMPRSPFSPRVRQARHRAHSRSPLAASGKGGNRALLQNALRRLARTPRRRCHLEPRGAQPAAPRPAVRQEKGRCAIKGNISKSGTRIYHVPGGRFYGQTRIDTSRGERWFCTEANARASGWRRSRQ